jgi:hypothetical protein
VAVNAPAGDVFEFIADVANFPKYLPTVQEAHSEEGGRVRLRGIARGHSYENTGYFRADREKRRLEWGNEVGRQYEGWMEVRSGDTETGLSEITLHIGLEPRAHVEQKAENAPHPEEEFLQESVASALDAIREALQSRH